MSINISTLTREWIQFLKNNQIVSTQSDPKTGKLKYRRKPNVQELIRFLEIKTDFDEEKVKAAIKTVLAAKNTQAPTSKPDAISGPKPEVPKPQPSLNGPKADRLSTWHHSEMTPGERPDYKEPVDGPQAPQAKKYSNDDAEDLEWRDVQPGQEDPLALTHKRKPRFKYRHKDNLTEDFYDRQGAELDEDDIKKIFKILLEPDAKPEEPEDDGPSEDELLAQKQDQMRKMKQIVREVLTPQQRKALWRALSENLSEAIINKADADAIFKDASYLRSKPSGLGKIFKGFQKDKIDVEDLRQAWALGPSGDGTDGYSNDTKDIERILLDFGYSPKEINKVFAQVLNAGDDEKYHSVQDAPSNSPAVQKLADLAKKYGLAKQLKEFLELEFSEDLGINNSKKAMWEDVKNIFTAIVQEERSERANLLKKQEHTQLGRTRK